MCRRTRLQWDLAALVDAGFLTVYCGTNSNGRIDGGKAAVLCRSTPMFMLVAEK